MPLRHTGSKQEAFVNKNSRLAKFVLALCLGLIAAAAPARAQEMTAGITGTVTDPSGAPIAGATVTAKDTQRGVVTANQTNSAGVYNFSALTVGHYEVSAEAKGFARVVYPAFTLVLNQVARIDLQLKVGTISQSVEVTGLAPLLQTDTTQLSTLIDATTNTTLPLATRNYLQLTLLAPGATTPEYAYMNTPQLMPAAARPYINGNREQSNEVLFEGIDNSEENNDEVGYAPNPDAIQEFNLITQNASAEFGNYSGGIVATSIKSGTNQLHGDAFEFIRNSALNANSWANNLVGAPRNALRWNMFGATLGGPIVKNKLFFFVDYQGQRADTPSSTQSTSVYTDAERSGDFGGLCTDSGGTFVAGVCSGGKGTVQLVNPVTKAPIPNNNLATAGFTINPVASNLFSSSAYPHATIQSGPGIANGQAPNYFSSSANQINNNQGDVKIDYVISDRDRIFGHYSQMHLEAPQLYSFALIGAPALPAEEPASNVGVEWTHAFSNAILNDYRMGYDIVNYKQSGANASSSLGNFGDTLGIANANVFAPGMPEISFGEGKFNLGSTALEQVFNTATIDFYDAVTITHGHHSFKVGAQFWRLRLDNAYAGNGGLLGSLTPTTATGSDLADFWIGSLPGTTTPYLDVATGTRGTAAENFGRRGNIWGVFAQDDWRITPTLTLNLGLRFEYHQPMAEVLRRQVNFGLLSGAIELPNQDGNGSALYDGYWGLGDWQPRIGIAWSPRFLPNTVIRASYGSSEYGEGGGANQQLMQNPPFSGATSAVSKSTFSAGFPVPASPCTIITTACYTATNIHIWDPHWRPELSQQINVTVQHQFNNSLTLQAGYVGQISDHLLNLMDYSQYELVTPATYSSSGVQLTAPVYSPGPFLAGNPTLKAAFTPTSGTYAFGTASNGISNYNALQLVLQKRMSNGLQAQVAYTYSKCMSNSGGFYGSWGTTQTSHGEVGWQNLYNTSSDYGPCFYDEAQVFSAYVVYQLPFGHGKQFGNNVNSVVNTIIGGWTVNSIVAVHSGNAMTSDGAFWDPSGTGGLGPYYENERADCLSALSYPKARLSGAQGIQWFNSTSFMEPNTGTFGNCGVGNIRGPGFTNVDISLLKNFRVTESKSFEFRTEFFNAFNHANLVAPVTSCGEYSPGVACNSNMGTITGSLDGRNIQFGLKFYF
jgi:Carboxypeptidase regulatory-like domain/TonB dependent receptor